MLIVVAAVLVLLLAMFKVVALVAALVMVSLPVPLMFRLDIVLAVRVVIVCKPPPTEALDTKLTVPGPTPFASCSVNAEVKKPKVVVEGTAAVPFKFTVAVLPAPPVPA